MFILRESINIKLLPSHYIVSKYTGHDTQIHPIFHIVTILMPIWHTQWFKQVSIFTIQQRYTQNIIHKLTVKHLWCAHKILEANSIAYNTVEYQSMTLKTKIWESIYIRTLWCTYSVFYNRQCLYHHTIRLYKDHYIHTQLHIALNLI